MSKHPPMAFGCPHCGAATHTRTSKTITRLLREVTAACNDATCGHVFIVHASAEQTLVPSMAPDGDVFIPLAPASRDSMATLLKQPSDRAASVAVAPRPPKPPKPPAPPKKSPARALASTPKPQQHGQPPVFDWAALARALAPHERQALPAATAAQ